MIGSTVSHYTILEKIGEGRMGVVYRPEDTRLKRAVALKFLPPDLTKDPDANARFVQEAQGASSLRNRPAAKTESCGWTSGLSGLCFMKCLPAYRGGSILNSGVS